MELVNIFNFNGNSLNFFIKVNETNPLMKYWIKANEVAEDILHYRTPSNAINKFCPNKISYGEAMARGWIFQGPRNEDPHIRDPQTLIIPISDVGRLISNSKLRIAKIMSNWMYDEVFPSIIISGGYQLPNVVPQIQYVEKSQEEKMEELQTLKCGCTYVPGNGPASEQCKCPHREQRRKARRNLVAQANVVKSRPNIQSGSKGGNKLWSNIRATEAKCLRLQKENGDLISENAKLKLLLLNLNLNEE